ncbi:hypothetical protein [Mesorhizobium sp. 10J20-29]
MLAHIVQRGWGQWIRQAYSYRNRKPAILETLPGRHRCPPGRILVVGYGVSDAEAARVTRRHYLEPVPGWPAKMLDMVGGDD